MDGDFLATMLAALYCSEPLGKMSHELQTLEADGKVLLDAGRAGQGPVCAAGAELYRRVADPESHFGMGCVVRHFEGHRDVDPVDVARRVRNKSLDLAAAAWTRLELPLSVFPLRLFRLIDVRTSETELSDIIHDFLRGPRCCLDAAFTLPLRNRMEHCQDTGGGFTGDAARRVYEDFLKALAEHAPCTNMGLERLLAQFKAAATSKAGHFAERLAWGGVLSQLMRRHLAHGHRDPRIAPTRHELAERGLR